MVSNSDSASLAKLLTKLLAILALFIARHIAAYAETLPSTEEQAGTGSVVHALLIGIDKYESKYGVEPLNGPENDVKLMREVLVQRFGVPNANVRVVLNPTHSTIKEEFASLLQRISPHDFVYIHYSGHGSTTRDPRDPRGEDQTWVPYMARSKKTVGDDYWDVLDKEIATWLEPLHKLTENVIFVSDSCHSGTVARGTQDGVRSGRAVVAQHPLVALLPILPMPNSGVRIGAARDFETAVELDFRDGNTCSDRNHCYGVFTWNWAQALRESSPGDTWGDVFSRANARITTLRGVYQRPQIEGEARRVIFGGSFKEVTPSVDVTESNADTVTLGAGALSGVSVGSIYRSIVPKDTHPAKLRVTRVDSVTSIADVLAGKVNRGDLVTEETHVYSAPRINLYIGTSPLRADAEPLAYVQQAITKALPTSLNGFNLVTNPKIADWSLHIARTTLDAKSPEQQGVRRLPDHPKCAAKCPPAQLWVVSRQGYLIDERMRFDLARPTEELPRLVNNLRKLAWAQEVLRLATQGNRTPLQLSVTILRPPSGDNRLCSEGSNSGSGWARFGPYPVLSIKTIPTLNDCLAFQIENHSTEHTWYGYVIAVSPDQEILSVLPPDDGGSDEARIPPSEHISSNSTRLYRLDRVGTETFLLLASDGPVNAQSLQQSGFRSSPRSSLETLLTQTATRRGEVESGSDWGAIRVNLEVLAQ